MTLGSLLTLGGYLVGALVFYVAARAEKRDSSGTWKVLLVGLIAGILGAKATEWLISGGRPLPRTPSLSSTPTRVGGPFSVAFWRVGPACFGLERAFGSAVRPEISLHLRCPLVR